MRTAAKRDGNEREIIDALRKIGATVMLHDSKAMSGEPDLVVGFRGRNLLIEVKLPGLKVSGAQLRFMQAWAGESVYVVHSVEEALAVVAPAIHS